MLDREPDNRALDRYARVAEVLCEKRIRDREKAWSELLALLDKWTIDLQLPRLNHYGISEDDFDEIVLNSRGSSMKTNPIVLTDDEIRSVLAARL